MDYAGALLRGKGPAPAAPTPVPVAAAPAVRPIARPTQSPIAPPKPAIPGSKQGLDPVECAGPFGKLLTETVVKIALAAGPAGLCNLGVSCKFLKEKILTAAVWKQLFDEVAVPKKPFVKFTIEFPGSAADVEDAAEDDAPEVKAEGKLISVSLAQVQRDPQPQKVVNYWLETVSQAQKDRAANERNITLGGGIVIDQAGKGRNKRIYASSSLADVSTWLDAIISLLKGSTYEKLDLQGGLLTLNRFGRGGTQIVVKYGETRAVFDFADLTNGIRKAVKEFVPFVGRCIVLLKQGAKGLADEELQAYNERTNIITSILKHQNLDRNLKAIKHYLEAGTIPHSNLPALFAKKRQEKQKLQQQASIEYQGMLDFVLSNLPSDYEDAKLQAARFTEEASQAQEEARRKAEEERLKAIEERKAKEQGVKAKKTEKPEEKQVKKEKKTGVKQVDGDGWITHSVVTVGANGEKIPAPAAPVPVTTAQPPQNEGGKKKNKKGNKDAVKPNQPAPAAAPRAAPIPDGASKEYLDKNPFSAALQESSYETPEEIQYRKNMANAVQTAPAKKSTKPQQKVQLKSAPQAAAAKPAQPAPPQKKTQKEKKDKAGREDAKRAMSSKGTKVAVKQDEWLAPTIVGVGAVLLVTVAYFFLQGA